MSLQALVWAIEKAPLENPTELAVMVALANEANSEGRNAYPAVDTIAEAARCNRRTVQRTLRVFESPTVNRPALIRRGDQRIADRIPYRYRPVVWDLNIDGDPDWTGPEGQPGEPDESPGVTNDHPSTEDNTPPERGSSGVSESHPSGATGNRPSKEPGVSSGVTQGAVVHRPTQRQPNNHPVPGSLASARSPGRGAEVVTLFDAPGQEVEKPVTAHNIVKAWVDHEKAADPPQRVPRSVSGHIAQQAKQLLADGFTPREIWFGIQAWAAKSYAGGLTTYVVEVTKAGDHKRPSTTDQRVIQGRNVADRWRDREARGEAG